MYGWIINDWLLLRFAIYDGLKIELTYLFIQLAYFDFISEHIRFCVCIRLPEPWWHRVPPSQDLDIRCVMMDYHSNPLICAGNAIVSISKPDHLFIYLLIQHLFWYRKKVYSINIFELFGRRAYAVAKSIYRNMSPISRLFNIQVVHILIFLVKQFLDCKHLNKRNQFVKVNGQDFTT